MKIKTVYLTILLCLCSSCTTNISPALTSPTTTENTTPSVTTNEPISVDTTQESLTLETTPTTEDPKSEDTIPSTTQDSESPAEILVSDYLLNGQPFSYKNLEVYGEFEENSTGLTLKGLSDMEDEEFLIIPEEINEKKITKISLNSEETAKLSPFVKISLPIGLTDITLSHIPCASILFVGNQADWLSSGPNISSFWGGNIDLYFLLNNSFEPVRDLVIDQGVTEIRDYAFQWCNITSLTLPSSVQKIGLNSFANCGRLARVTLNEGLKNITANAFASCNHLTSITLPSTVTELGISAFSCDNLLVVEIKEGLDLTNGSLTNAFLNSFRIFSFINHSQEKSYTSPFIRITKDNINDGDIFTLGGYYFGKCGDSFTMLTYLGEEKILHLPSSFDYDGNTISSYIIGSRCFYHESKALQYNSLIDYDYISQTPLIEEIYVPSSISNIEGSFPFYHGAYFSEDIYYLKKAYFDMTKERLESFPFMQNKNYLYSYTEIYYLENNNYTLYERE